MWKLWAEMHLGERNQEARTGREKVRWGTDVEASMYEALQVGVCPDPKARGARIRRQGSSEKLYKQLMSRRHGTDVATDSVLESGRAWNSILDHGVIKIYSYHFLNTDFARSCSKCTIHLVLTTALWIKYYYNRVQFIEEDTKTDCLNDLPKKTQ